jgi:hypothetical protein
MRAEAHAPGRILVALTCGLLAYLAWHHWQLITSPVPLDVFENAMPFITGLIAEGGNPYRFENQPLYTNVYPPLYNLLAAPLSHLFGNSLLFHRCLSGAFIIASCGLCHAAARRCGAGHGYAFAAATLLYAALLYFSTPVASASSTGLFLYLLCLLVPWCRNFSHGSLLLSACCGVLAFYGKQYFAAAPAFLALYLLLFVSRRGAALYVAAVATLLVASVALVYATSPYYFDNTLFAVRAAAAMFRQPAHMAGQAGLFLLIYGGLLAALALGCWRERRFSLRALDSVPGYLWFCLLLATALFAAYLGHSRGNHMSYLFQMMSPLLLPIALARLARQSADRWLGLAGIAITGAAAATLLPPSLKVDLRPWQQVERIVAGAENLYADPLVLHLLVKHGKGVNEGPLTEWFHFALFKPAWLVREAPEKRIRTMTDAHIAVVNDAIEQRRYDAVILRRGRFGIIGAAREGFPFEPGDGQAAFRANYRLAERIELPMPERKGGGNRQLQVWLPREGTVSRPETLSPGS